MARSPQNGKKDLRLGNFTGKRVNDGDRRSRIIHKAFFTGFVDLLHGELEGFGKATVAFAKGRVAVSLAICAHNVLAPE